MLKTIRRVIRWTGDRRKRLYKGFVYSFFQTMFIAMPIMSVSFLLEQILLDIEGKKLFDQRLVIYSLLFMIAMVLGRFVMAYLKAVNQESIAYERTTMERITIGDILKRVSLGFYEKRNVGELTAAITADLSYLEMYSMKMVDTVVNGYIGIAAMTLCMVFYSISVALIIVLATILSAFALKLLGYFSRKNSARHRKSQEDMVGATIEYVRGIPIVKAFKQEGVSVARIEKAYADSRRINIKIERNYCPCNCLHLLILKLASTAIVGVAAMSALYGGMEIPTMLTLLLFSFVIFGHVETVNSAEHVLSMIDATMDKVEDIKNARFIDENGKDIGLPSYDISFEHVTFGYDARKVLSNVNFYLPEHSTTAIIGPSGSGKTTICSLIARFYDIDEGRICIGGVDIREISCDCLLANISMVFQKVYLFHDTILNNIRFGRPEASMEEVEEIARKANCHDFISKLPDGYLTMIGEGGSTLSGGEKQRISIARAMLKDAPIVILDEATASIDPENEHEIQAAIEKLVKGKTVITIAHRLATIQNADQIVVVDHGEIVQKGTHKELLDQEGVYRKYMNIRSKAEQWSIAK